MSNSNNKTIGLKGLGALAVSAVAITALSYSISRVNDIVTDGQNKCLNLENEFSQAYLRNPESANSDFIARGGSINQVTDKKTEKISKIYSISAAQAGVDVEEVAYALNMGVDAVQCKFDEPQYYP